VQLWYHGFLKDVKNPFEKSCTLVSLPRKKHIVSLPFFQISFFKTFQKGSTDTSLLVCFRLGFSAGCAQEQELQLARFESLMFNYFSLTYSTGDSTSSPKKCQWFRVDQWFRDRIPSKKPDSPPPSSRGKSSQPAIHCKGGKTEDVRYGAGRKRIVRLGWNLGHFDTARGV